MLQNRPGFVLFYPLGHHIHYVVHDRSTKFQIKVGLHTLFRHGFGNALRVTTLELSGQQIPKPPLQQRRDSSHEEEPNPPTGRPETTSGSLTDGALEQIGKINLEAK